MTWFWHKRKNTWNEKDNELYYHTNNSYNWFKKIMLSGMLFLVVYAFHTFDTVVTGFVDKAVGYIVCVDTDFDYAKQEISRYLPGTLDTTVLKRVQNILVKPADPLLYMSKPIEGKLVKTFGWQVDQNSKQEVYFQGIAIETAMGSAVHATAPGKVKFITESARFGKTLLIEHGNNIETLYGHLGEVLVTQGDPISQEQVVGRVGKTGLVKVPTLYFELRDKGIAIDPLTRIKGDFFTLERR